jgi:hypothetical protein
VLAITLDYLQSAKKLAMADSVTTAATGRRPVLSGQ